MRLYSTTKMKRIMLLAVYSTLTVAIVIFSMTTFHLRQEPKARVNTNVSTVASPVYIFKELNGDVAVYIEGRTEPMQMLGIDILSLPHADQALLKDGVIAKTESELYARIDDYTG